MPGTGSERGGEAVSHSDPPQTTNTSHATCWKNAERTCCVVVLSWSRKYTFSIMRDLFEPFLGFLISNIRLEKYDQSHLIVKRSTRDPTNPCCLCEGQKMWSLVISAYQWARLSARGQAADSCSHPEKIPWTDSSALLLWQLVLTESSNRHPAYHFQDLLRRKSCL